MRYKVVKKFMQLRQFRWILNVFKISFLFRSYIPLSLQHTHWIGEFSHQTRGTACRSEYPRDFDQPRKSNFPRLGSVFYLHTPLDNRTRRNRRVRFWVNKVDDVRGRTPFHQLSELTFWIDTIWHSPSADADMPLLLVISVDVAQGSSRCWVRLFQ
jgi:hypothetical protein